MAKGKPSRKKKPNGAEKRVANGKGAAKGKRATKRTPARKQKSRSATRSRGGNSARRKAPAARRERVRRRTAVRARGRAERAGEITLPPSPELGPVSAGQSGDIEGLHDMPGADSESVEELAAEGQDFEAELVDAVEGAPDPDASEVHTREIPEGEVPEEYEDDEKPGRSRR